MRRTWQPVIDCLEARVLLSAGLLASDSDIGSPSPAGSVNFANGVYTVTAGGSGIGGTSDQFNFAFNNYSGNATLSARVNSLTNSSPGAQAGLMIRNDSSAGSAFVGLFVTPSSGLELITRTADNASASQASIGGIAPPEYLELSLSGQTVTALYSANGTTWSQLNTETITLGTSAMIGIAASSDNPASATTAAVSSLNILPQSWSNSDVGSPPLPGGAGFNPGSDQFTAIGSGSGIGGSSDQFNLTDYSVTGNASVSALVNSMTGTASGAGAAVLLRADTTATSLFAAVEELAQNTVEFVGRNAGGTFSFAPVTVTSPVWLQVTEQGTTFSGYYSTDDIHWTQLGTAESISMPSSTIIGGIGVWSNNASATNTALFSNVNITQGGWTDSDVGAPPISGSADYDAPSDTTNLMGSGADIYGTSDQFNFDSTSMTGNGNVIAYVNSIANTNAWAKAGVMERNDLTAGSAFAGVFVSPTSGIVFEWRTSAGGAVSQEVSSPSGGPTPAPVGLELTRSGNSFSAYYSTDGISWIQVGPAQTVALNSGALAGIAVTSHNTSADCTAAFSSVSVGSENPPGAGIYSSTDQLFLNDLEYRESMYFYDESNSTTGLTPDNALANGGSPSADSSIAAVGFDLTALTIADARGWLTHAQAYQRALTTITFLYNSGAQVNGFYYHFLNETTGARYGTSEVSSVDTAELMAGVLDAAQYWSGTALQTTANAMFDRVDWAWMQESSGVYYGAWTPESGFSGGYGDFSEAALLYLLGLGSPTYPTSVASWYAWSRTPVENYSGYTYVEADDAALFTEQYPQAWFNLRGLADGTGLNFYQNSQLATLAQRQFQINLSSTYSDYGPNMWGLTPAEGINGYTVWGGPPAYGPIDGTVVPTGPGGSLEFEPRDSINALEYMKQTYGSSIYEKYGFVDAFNPLKNYVSTLALGIDVGMTLVAAENSRSDLVWNTFSQSAVAQQAVEKAFPTQPVWAVNGDGNWNTATNWTTKAVPNGAGADANFLDITPPAQTVYSDVPITEGTIDFNSASEYVIAGAGSLTLEGSGANGATIEVDQGTAEINLPLTLASNTTFDVGAGATLIIGNPMTVNSGVTLTTTGGGTVIYLSIVNIAAGAGVTFAGSTSISGLSLASGATATLGGSGSVLEISSLSIAGAINLQNNTLIINYGSGPDPIAAIRAELVSGYAGGLWDGPGINSTTAAANSASYGLGFADSADPGNPAALPSGTLEVKYTLLGDANLDGKVNGTDFAILSANFNQGATSWDQGDFNYDGTVNGTDFALLSSNFNQASNAPAAIMPLSASAVANTTDAVAAPPLTGNSPLDKTQNGTGKVSAAVLHPQNSGSNRRSRTGKNGPA